MSDPRYRTSPLCALDEIANASWPSVNGDDPVKRIQAFAQQVLRDARRSAKTTGD